MKKDVDKIRKKQSLKNILADILSMVINLFR